MTLTDLASWGTVLSGLAVTASLIYVAIQTNQSIRHTRALIQQGSTARTTAIRLAMMDSDRTAAFLEGNGQEATPKAVRQLQFMCQCLTALDALEDHYLQSQARLMSAEQLARGKEDFRWLFSQPGVRAFWHGMRGDQSRAAPGFCAFVDSVCEAAPSSTLTSDEPR